MAKGDQYRCDWCTFSWRTKSEVNPIRCPSCEDTNIINEVESFKKILGEENILRVDKKLKKAPVISEKKLEGKSEDEIKEKNFFLRLFKKK